MPYVITEVKSEYWPAKAKVEKKLKAFGLSVDRIIKVGDKYSYPAPAKPGVGFQLDLGPGLQEHIVATAGKARLSEKSLHYYSTKLKFKADLAFFGRNGIDGRMFVEIEFRPNIEKDLVKFHIGAKAKTLAVAVLIVTINRKCVNANYTTMPEFARSERVIEEFDPDYPLLLLGFRGERC
jgi:hypothetical protein